MWGYARDGERALTCALEVIVYQIVVYILATELSLAILIGSACAVTLSLGTFHTAVRSPHSLEQR